MEGINKLPDEVLLYIISLLPLKDTVRTSVLSTRWRYLYASIPNLDLNFQAIPVASQVGFMDFIDRLFILRDRTPVDKLRLSCLYSQAIDPLHLQGWICAVIRFGIREIQIRFEDSEDVLLPSNLFTCTTLVNLKLNFHSESGFQVPAKVCLPSLKVLHLKNAICFHKDDSAERLFLNCSVLEDLVISSYFGEHDDCKLIISSSTLKRLTIKSISYEDCNSFEIVLNAPNLVYLKYIGCESNSHFHVFVNVRSLTEAHINFQRYLLEQDYFFSARARDLLTGIRNVQTLCLPCSTLHHFKVLNVPIPLFRNLTNLRITYWRPFSFSGLPNLLAQCHRLQLLVLELSTDYDPEEPFIWDPYPWNELKESGAICLLSGLKTLEVLSFVGGEHQMEMVKYFLGSARVLENLKIQIKASEEKQLMITKELLMLPKVSQKCRVIFV